MQSVADAVHRNGMKFLLWFEIERTRGKSPIVREHPEYFIWPDGREDGSGLIDYGNPTAWQWAYDMSETCIAGEVPIRRPCAATAFMRWRTGARTARGRDRVVAEGDGRIQARATVSVR